MASSVGEGEGSEEGSWAALEKDNSVVVEVATPVEHYAESWVDWVGEE